MNYLGHLYFSKEKPDLMVANLFGDFIKGKDYSFLPKIVQEGVLLHRQIDDYVDHHPTVTELRLHLYNELPKIAGIAIDLYFDHLLAKDWSTYHSKSLDEFVDPFLAYTKNAKNLKFNNPKYEYPQHFINLLNAISKHNLLKRYVHLDGLAMASEGLSRRISFENNLDMAVVVFQNNEKRIEAAFEVYMKAAKLRFNVKD
ncbi:DUF479 domain-containing protein [Brumimicrobium glaciale]|uniref:DUF479 domain-containing protein n=1 Tax=Brumimicrobium glaciale TaxID=200475 RepID=A0A4Q4KFX3_9FLAO|nr:ACP phosphodiesterase [Brumimicrobium glaciale]RYM32063.1 DUF479 domain-containing protein [Brumimicrobium glaciale]